jgi:amidophosphoribosyltransferase
LLEHGEHFPIPELDKPQEACGVFGIYDLEGNQNLAQLTYLGLQALQHRGQEAAGIAVSTGDSIMVVKDTGKVITALGGSKLDGLPEGFIASGHVRYGTVETKEIDKFRAAQPIYARGEGGNFTLGHNGHVINTQELCTAHGYNLQSFASDSEIITRLISDQYHSGVDLSKAVGTAVPEVEGAFSLVIMGEKELIGVRDRNGIRPLVLGRFGNSGYALASEKAALDTIGAHYEREVETGEMVVINSDGLASYHPFDSIDPRLCLFEYVYLSRPGNYLNGKNVHESRKEAGEFLANQSPVDGDIVIDMPESGRGAAIGYAKASGIPYDMGFDRNHSVDRAFITPGQEARAGKIRLKLAALAEVVRGKRVIAVDDSIVRGDTTHQTVKMLRDNGATEVHLRIASPPIKWPCFYGVDMKTRGELIAAQKDTIQEICDYIGADSLDYLSLENLVKSTGNHIGQLCTGCWTGIYPTKVSLEQQKS